MKPSNNHVKALIDTCAENVSRLVLWELWQVENSNRRISNGETLTADEIGKLEKIAGRFKGEA